MLKYDSDYVYRSADVDYPYRNATPIRSAPKHPSLMSSRALLPSNSYSSFASRDARPIARKPSNRSTVWQGDGNRQQRATPALPSQPSTSSTHGSHTFTQADEGGVIPPNQSTTCNRCLSVVLIAFLLILTAALSFVVGQYYGTRPPSSDYPSMVTIVDDDTTPLTMVYDDTSLHSIYPPSTIFAHRRRTDGGTAEESILFIDGRHGVHRHFPSPPHVVPEHYDIFLDISHLLSDRRIDGRTAIDVRVRRRTMTIVVHVRETLSVDHVRVVHEDGDEILDIRHVHEGGRLNISLGEPMQSGMRYTVEIEYKVRVTCNHESGISPSSPPSIPTTGIVCAMEGGSLSGFVTRFEPSLASSVFPCFDEPQLKATFNMSVRHDMGFTLLGNMPIANQVTEEGNMVLVEFDTTPLMSTYGVSLAMGRLGFVEGHTASPSSVPVRVYTTPALLADMQMALNYTVRTLEGMEEMTGVVAVSLPKLDLVVMPRLRLAGAAAMEHWGLITFYYAEAVAMHSSSPSLDVYKKRRLLAHELLHQWIGNLVTVRRWSEIWIQEALTTYISNKFIGEPFLSDHHERDMSEKMDGALLRQMRPSHSSALVRHADKVVLDDVDMAELFDRHDMYYRGWMVVRMIEKVVGEGAMKESIVKLVTRHAYGNVNGTDYFDTLGIVRFEGKDRRAETMFDAWVTKRGVPSLHVHLDGSMLLLTQTTADVNDHRQFLPVDLRASTTNVTTERPWPIALRLRDDEGATWEVYCDAARHRRRIDGLNLRRSTAWIIANVDYAAPMRVNYEEGLWRRLIDQLHRKHEVFSVFERVQMVIDSDHFLAESNEMHLHVRLYAYLIKERHVAVLLVAVPRMHRLLDLLQSTELFALVAIYWKESIVSMTRVLEGEEEGDVSRQLDTLNCVLQTTKCRINTHELGGVISSLAYHNLLSGQRGRVIGRACASLANLADGPIIEQLIAQLPLLDHHLAQSNMVTLLSCVVGNARARDAVGEWMERSFDVVNWAIDFLPLLTHTRNDDLRAYIWCHTLDKLHDKPAEEGEDDVLTFPPHTVRLLARSRDERAIHSIRTFDELRCATKLFGVSHPHIRWVSARLSWLTNSVGPSMRAWLFRSITL